jgi:hypothetical protein
MAAWWAWSGPAPIKAPVVAVKPATQAEPSAGPTEIVPGVVSIVNVDRMVGQICTVEFQVNGTGISPSGLMFLNSHPDYQSRDTFTVVIYPEAGKVLGITGRDDLKSRYDGKTVQVRGKVELYKAKDQPQIKVEKPEQIVSVR